jgi:hypothetical protein
MSIHSLRRGVCCGTDKAHCLVKQYRFVAARIQPPEFQGSGRQIVDRKKKPRFPFFAGYRRYVKPRMRPRPGHSAVNYSNPMGIILEILGDPSSSSFIAYGMRQFEFDSLVNQLYMLSQFEEQYLELVCDEFPDVPDVMKPGPRSAQPPQRP